MPPGLGLDLYSTYTDPEDNLGPLLDGLYDLCDLDRDLSEACKVLIGLCAFSLLPSSASALAPSLNSFAVSTSAGNSFWLSFPPIGIGWETDSRSSSGVASGYFQGTTGVAGAGRGGRAAFHFDTLVRFTDCLDFPRVS